MAIDPMGALSTAEPNWGAGQLGFVSPQSQTLCEERPSRHPRFHRQGIESMESAEDLIRDNHAR